MVAGLVVCGVIALVGGLKSSSNYGLAETEADRIASSNLWVGDEDEERR